jgi:hypothetical protein
MIHPEDKSSEWVYFSYDYNKEADLAKHYGKTIKEIAATDDGIALKFTDGTGIELLDGRQSCCERRYMTWDKDELSYLVGGTLTKIEEKPADTIEKDYEVHEICFLEITTDKGHANVANHNEHNGYYGGFSLYVKELS